MMWYPLLAEIAVLMEISYEEALERLREGVSWND